MTAMNYTPTPGEAQAGAHAGFVVIGTAEAVQSAERQLAEALRSYEDVVDRVRLRLSEGDRMNELGEVQSRGNALDVAISRLESKADALKSILHYLGDAVFNTEGSEDRRDLENIRDWFASIAQASPRVRTVALSGLDSVTRAKRAEILGVKP